MTEASSADMLQAGHMSPAEQLGNATWPGDAHKHQRMAQLNQRCDLFWRCSASEEENAPPCALASAWG